MVARCVCSGVVSGRVAMEQIRDSTYEAKWSQIRADTEFKVWIP